MTRVQYWACRACAHRNADEDGPVCENCGVDNSRESNEAVLKIIQDACDGALREQRFGLAAMYVVNELNRGGWKIVRDDDAR